MATEDKFPTIRDLRDALSRLCDLGLGDMPTQVTVVPASTILAIARATAPDEIAKNRKPLLMIEIRNYTGRMAPVIISSDYLDTGEMPIYPQ